MTRSKPLLFWLLLVTALVWFSNLEYRKLVRPDEGRYAEIPREMVVSHDWVTPRLNGIKYFEKPALQYWTTAVAYTVFGEHHWTARLWSALTGFLGILLAFYTGRRLFGEKAGLFAAAVLGSSLLYTLIGHINTLDMGVTFFMELGLMGFLLAQDDSATEKGRRFWMHVVWAAMALSILSKGLIGIVLPGAVLVIYTLIQRDWRLWTRLHLASGMLLMLAISAPWFVLVSKANPEFFHFFFIHEHFERFLTKEHHRFQPWYYFIPILLAGMLPWAVTLFDSLFRSWQRADTRFQPNRFLAIWAVFIYFFFSISDSKLPSYILPIFPAVALLIGQRIAQIEPKRLFWQILPVAMLAAVALAMVPRVTRIADSEVPLPLYQHFVPWLAAAAAVFLAGTLYALFNIRRERITHAVVGLSLASLIAGQLGISGHDALSPANSSYHLIPKIQPYLKPNTPFYSVKMYEQTLPFYIKQTVTLVGFKDEMAFGLEQQPELWIPDLSTFEQQWRKQPYALAIMPPWMYSQLEKELPMVEVARDTRRVVVRTP